MKLIDDLRRENLSALAEALGGVSALARTLDRDDAQVSQWTTGALLPSGKRRGMRSDTARWIEITTGKPPGWLDTDHSPQNTFLTAEPPLFQYPVKPAHSRPLVQAICEMAEQIDDIGLAELAGYARCLVGKNPLVKEKRASSQ